MKAKMTYTIISDMDSNLKVQDFAKKHCTSKNAITMQAYGCLLDEHVLVKTTFESDELPVVVYPEFVNDFFDGHKLAIRRKIMFVYKEEES